MAKPGHTATLGLLSVTPSSARLVDGLLFSRPSAGPRRAARRGQEGRPEEAGSPQSPGAFGAAPDEAARGLRASVAPRRGGEQPGRIWPPRVRTSSLSAPAPRRPQPACRPRTPRPSRESHGLHGGSGRSGLSHEKVPARRLCLVPVRTPPLRRPTHRRSPRGCAVGAGSQERRGRCRSRAAFAVTRSSELSGLGRSHLPQRQSVCMTIGATRGEAVALALRLLLLASRGAVGLSPAPAGHPPRVTQRREAQCSVRSRAQRRLCGDVRGPRCRAPLSRDGTWK